MHAENASRNAALWIHRIFMLNWNQAILLQFHLEQDQCKTWRTLYKRLAKQIFFSLKTITKKQKSEFNLFLTSFIAK